MHPILALVYVVLDLYKWVLIIYVVLDWLIAFNVINTYNRFVATVRDILARLTEPVLRWIRGFVPAVGGIDLSPLVALLGIWFIQYVLVYYGGRRAGDRDAARHPPRRARRAEGVAQPRRRPRR